MSFDEQRGDAITAPPEPTVISSHTKINFVEGGITIAIRFQGRR